MITAKVLGWHINLEPCDGPDILRKLQGMEITVSNVASLMLKLVPAAPAALQLDVRAISVRELGLRGNVTLQKIYDRATYHGLKLCRWDVAPQLLLNFGPDFLGTELHRLAMEPVLVPGVGLCIFVVGHPTNLTRLMFSHGDPTLRWDLDRKFLFAVI